MIPSGDGVLRGGTCVRWGRKVKRGRRPPPFFRTGEVTASFRPSSSRPWLSSPCLLSPPSCWDYCASAHAHHRGCRLARSPDVGARRLSVPSTRWRGALELVTRASLGLAYACHPHTRCRL